jgi:hypothetical protein
LPASPWRERGRSGRSERDAARTLEEKLTRFADEEGIIVFSDTLAINDWQIQLFDLPTRPPHKRN